MRIEYATFTEAWPRSYNGDYIRVVEMPEEHRALFVLCDGMADMLWVTWQAVP